jgi:hypothetical protein
VSARKREAAQLILREEVLSVRSIKRYSNTTEKKTGKLESYVRSTIRSRQLVNPLRYES